MAVRVCLVGCGSQARNSYAGPLLRYQREHPDTVLACCCDVNEQAVKDYARSVGFQRFSTDCETMLRNETPDAVLLVTPFTVTAALARLVLSMRIPALIEKPLGVNAEEALSIAEAAARSGTINQAAFNRRHIPLIRELRKRIGNKAVRHVDYRMHRVNRLESHFHTTAVHGLDLVEYLTGSRCVRMDCSYQSLNQPGKDAVNIQALARYENNATASMSFCPAAGLVCEQLCVALDRETFYVDLPIWGARGNIGSLEHYADGRLLLRETGSEISDGDSMPDSNGFTWQLSLFLDSVRDGRQPADDVRSGLDAMRLADCFARRETVYISV